MGLRTAGNYETLQTVINQTLRRLALVVLVMLATTAQAQFNFEQLANGTYIITKCTSSAATVTIPSTIAGKPVSTIGNWAFFTLDTLRNVQIPNSVKYIRWGAFSGCTSLTNITIPMGLMEIDGQAFGGCRSLTKVNIPDSVSRIRSLAFSRCFGLTNVVIGANVTNIEDSAFAYCTNLTSVYFRGDAPSVGAAFTADENATVYYLAGTTGWGAMFGGRPTAFWLPRIETGSSSFGFGMNEFRFDIRWTRHQTIVVETTTNSANPIWLPIRTNFLYDDLLYFGDPDWTNHQSRFYRIRSP